MLNRSTASSLALDNVDGSVLDLPTCGDWPSLS